jgi:hypothetical protein
VHRHNKSLLLQHITVKVLSTHYDSMVGLISNFLNYSSRYGGQVLENSRLFFVPNFHTMKMTRDTIAFLLWSIERVMCSHESLMLGH